MDPYAIIQRHCDPGSLAYEMLVTHSEAVADYAVEIATACGQVLDMQFIREGALLHDIGILFTDKPALGCHGREPYIRHGVLGRQLLEQEGLQRHALVAERHIGVGLSIADIRAQKLPLPERDMRPISAEEKIITLADCFYTKTPGELKNRWPLEDVRGRIVYFGQDKREVLDDLLREFGLLA